MEFTQPQKLEIIKEIRKAENKEEKRKIADKYGIPQTKIFGWMGGFESQKSYLKHKEVRKNGKKEKELLDSST